jgi:hypothetical protein
MGALWEPRPRGDSWWSAGLYRDEGVAPTKKAFIGLSEELLGLSSKPHYCALAPESFTTLAHLVISVAW